MNHLQLAEKLHAALQSVPAAQLPDTLRTFAGQLPATWTPDDTRVAHAWATGVGESLVSPGERGIPRFVDKRIIAHGPNGITVITDDHHQTLIPTSDHLPRLRHLVTAEGYQVTDEAVTLLKRVAAAPPSTPNTTPDEIVPLLFDGTVDGLRGIPLEDLTSIPGRRRKNFREFGVDNAHDVMFTVPRRYLDRSEVAQVRHLTETGEDTCIVGEVTGVTTDARRRMARIKVSDGTGTITATYFNAVWMGKRFSKGDRVIMYGRPEKYARTNTWSMVNPLLDPHADTTAPIIPIYPQSAKSGVTTWDVRRAAEEVISRVDTLADPLPDSIRSEHNLIDRWPALIGLHSPTSMEHAEAARTRIAFDELFRMQTALLLTRSADAAEAGVAHTPTGELTDLLYTQLSFPLTNAQERALSVITADLRRPHPMHRLLQGDVGAGKTLVALISLLSALESGHQGALMAPTEILARQLYAETLERTADITRNDGTPLTIEFFTNRLRGKKREAALQRLADGDIDIAVGTHALLVDDIQFRSLGLVVIDEQHRFGVEQRAALRSKGPDGAKPDTLIMTATPIPRTSAMTVFGDLDVAVLDELPPGRTPIATTWIDAEPELTQATAEPWASIHRHVAAGRQAFVVTPLIEESEKLQATSAIETHDALANGALHGLRLGLVHGQQKVDDRESIMAQFRDGDLDVLVSTTVIEVGVNIPAASMIAILSAERFGISQLHQLRGRVGRGVAASECFLVARARSSDSRTRMQALVDSTDGFHLAAVDASLRGTGSVYGSAQHGQSDLLVADIERDKQLLFAAREAALELLDNDPDLARHPVLRHEIESALTPEARQWLLSN